MIDKETKWMNQKKADINIITKIHKKDIINE